MQKDQIQIGNTYTAKVTDKVVPVRIDAEHPSGGWTAINLVTNKTIRIKSAQRLREEVKASGNPASTKRPVKKKLTAAERKALQAQHKADPENARVRDERSESKDGMTASERAMVTSAQRAKKDGKATKDAKPAAQRNTGERGAKGGERDASGDKPMSLLDAAAHLLSLGTGDNPGAMRCQDIVDLAIERGLWTPGEGKTPANTLYASILREIKTKGASGGSRFVKAERGKFALAPGMKKGA
jgi:hypothetical protein